MKRICTAIICIVALAGMVRAQDKRVRWQRSAEPTQPTLQLFLSAQAISLPTAETHRHGDFEFEISHRFIPRISDGYTELYGLDGPVNMRLALGYAVTDDILVTLGRSNADDNTDLWVKYRALAIRNDILPAVIGLRAGAAWNPIRVSRIDNDTLYTRVRDHHRNFQYYFQAIIDVMPDDRIGLGIVPSYLINRDIRLPEREQSFALGLHAQYYFLTRWSLVGEWTPTLTERYGRHNPGAVGLEMKAGGHFFKLFVTNQTLLNPSQYLSGSPYVFGMDDLRLGFMITRLL